MTSEHETFEEFLLDVMNESGLRQTTFDPASSDVGNGGGGGEYAHNQQPEQPTPHTEQSDRRMSPDESITTTTRDMVIRDLVSRGLTRSQANIAVDCLYNPAVLCLLYKDGTMANSHGATTSPQIYRPTQSPVPVMFSPRSTPPHQSMTGALHQRSSFNSPISNPENFISLETFNDIVATLQIERLAKLNPNAIEIKSAAISRRDAINRAMSPFVEHLEAIHNRIREGMNAHLATSNIQQKSGRRSRAITRSEAPLVNLLSSAESSTQVRVFKYDTDGKIDISLALSFPGLTSAINDTYIVELTNRKNGVRRTNSCSTYIVNAQIARMLVLAHRSTKHAYALTIGDMVVPSSLHTEDDFTPIIEKYIEDNKSAIAAAHRAWCVTLEKYSTLIHGLITAATPSVALGANDDDQTLSPPPVNKRRT